TAYIDDTVEIAQDTVIYPSVCISGVSEIGKRCSIGPNCSLKDVRLGEGTVVKFGSCLDGAVAESSCEIGPLAHLRPGAQLKNGAKVGNFSEVKKSVIGERSKVNHLSYVGDATVGSGVNIGAGTITCNYDGVKKHPTVLGDKVFVGSNVNLVAPVTVGAGAVIAAGSTITDDIPEGVLAIARERQVIKRLKQKV
ncbi:MAG TPA: DapH/DapD/GlmU-related protein, partial [Elusimicrobiales bacterium]|nr:DapH/DapD/GlmU-related protein [Elusimicrobiales bacterium]